MEEVRRGTKKKSGASGQKNPPPAEGLPPILPNGHGRSTLSWRSILPISMPTVCACDAHALPSIEAHHSS